MNNLVIKIKQVVNGKWLENCYILSLDGNAIIIDPGGNFDYMCRYLEEENLSLIAIVNTHAHFDHVVSVADLLKKYQCPFYLHSEDERLLKSANLYMKLFEGEGKIETPVVNHYLDKIGPFLVIDNFKIEILFTPGHTNGSVCLAIDNCLFTGDTLLKGNIGRIDLPGANKQKLRQSLLMISDLHPGLILYPGHGHTTTLAAELSFNKPFNDFIA